MVLGYIETRFPLDRDEATGETVQASQWEYLIEESVPEKVFLEFVSETKDMKRQGNTGIYIDCAGVEYRWAVN